MRLEEKYTEGKDYQWEETLTWYNIVQRDMGYLPMLKARKLKLSSPISNCEIELTNPKDHFSCLREWIEGDENTAIKNVRIIT